MGAKYLEEFKSDPLLKPWLESGYRKHLRRAKTKDFNKLLESNEGILVESAYGRLWASPLMPVEEIPKPLKRLQLSNFKVIDSREIFENSPDLSLVLNAELEMTFGKAAIAVAHAVQNLALASSLDIATLWDTFTIAIRSDESLLTAKETVSLYGENCIFAEVKDFGLTEVPAGSITAQAFLMKD